MLQKNSRYLFQVFIFICIYCSLFAGLVFLQIGTPTASSQALSLLTTKNWGLAEHISTRKILLVGGSNVDFSLRAEMIEKETHIRTLNIGTTAGFGVEYILDKAKEVLKPGDIVIGAFEYSFYNYRGIPNSVASDFILSRDPDYFYKLPVWDKIKYVAAFTPAEMLQRFIKRFKPDMIVQDVYSQPDTINNYGDNNLNRDTSWPRAVMWRARLDSFLAAKYSAKLTDTVGIDRIKEFSSWCKDNQVELLVTFPSFMYFPEYKKPQQERFYNSVVDFYKSIDMPVLGNPYDFMYPKENFFDTEYHLNAEAAERRTHKLLLLLKSKYPNFSSRAYDSYRAKKL